MVKSPKYRTFDGHRYERVGSAPTDKKTATDWADFQRKVNRLSARVVKVGTKYTIYIRRAKR